MSQQNTLYAILGVEASASTEEIEAAYAARLSEAQEAGTETSLLKIAHDDLRIPELRAAYDRKLARQNTIPDIMYETVESKSGGHRYSLWFLVLLIALGAAYWWKKPVTKSSPPLSTVQLKTENPPSPPTSAPPYAEPATTPVPATACTMKSRGINGEKMLRQLNRIETHDPIWAAI